MGIGVMLFKNSIILFTLALSFSIASSYASDCNLYSCGGLTLPESARNFIAKGYSNVEIKTLNSNKYISLTSENDVNKCAVIFSVKDNKIENTPSAGEDGKLCNLSVTSGNIVSSYRDQGVWFNDVYKVSKDDVWTLLLSDSCADCQQVKRTYYTDGVKSHVFLMSEGDKYSARKPLNGVVLVEKSTLYSMPEEQKKLKAYLVKGDVFKLSDMSDDGAFYQIEYVTSSGKKTVYWIKSDDFEIK